MTIIIVLVYKAIIILLQQWLLCTEEGAELHMDL